MQLVGALTELQLRTGHARAMTAMGCLRATTIVSALGALGVTGRVAVAEPVMLVGVATTGQVAVAEPVALADRWPAVPRDRSLSLEDQVTDRLTELGNVLGRHLELLSHDTFALTVDCHLRRAHLRLGAGDDQTFAVRLDSDVQFEDLNAHVRARIDLGFRGHAVHLELPDFEMSPATYRGDYGIELKLPLFARSF